LPAIAIWLSRHITIGYSDNSIGECMNRRLFCAVVALLFFQAYDIYAQAIPTPLRNPREAVVQLYEVISDTSDPREIYGSLSVDLQSDLWMLQLEDFVAQNPRLTVEQRSLTMEALGLLASGVLQRKASPSTTVATQAQMEIDGLASRTAQIFPGFGKFVFGRMGRYAILTSVDALEMEVAEKVPSAPPTIRREKPVTVSSRIVTVNASCECSTESPYCGAGSITAPSYSCIRRPAQCTRTTWGCGFLFTYGCNGLCE